jgi:long-chain acyl-CoA synthetase
VAQGDAEREEKAIMIDFVSKFDAERLGIPNHARNTPDKPALIMNEASISFGALERRTNSLANGLLHLGVAPGDRVAVLMHNSPELIEVWSAAGKIGVTPIAVNYRFKEDELAYIVNDSGSRALIFGQEFESVVMTARPKITAPARIYISSGDSSLAGVFDLADLFEKWPPTPPQIGMNFHGVSSGLIYTSGTTGRPKGVFKTSKSRLNTLLGYAHVFESTYDDTHLVAGPLYHSAPYAWAAFSLLLGNPLVIMPRFDAEDFLRLIERHRATTTFVVPTMLNRILNLPDEVRAGYDISSLRVLVMAGESCPFPLKKRAVEFFEKARVFEFYGGTETAVATALMPEDQLRKPGSCGKPVLGSQIRLLDEHKREVPEGEIGILYVKSDFLMDGYYNNPEATAACFHDGYMTIGDMARRDEEGYYYIADRAVDMVLSGGVNIYPAEIEEVLYDHPGIYDAAIIGAPDSDWGEKLIAYVIPVEGSGLKGQDVISFVERRLASYKKPKEVIMTDEIPYSPSGKVLKRALREDYSRRCARRKSPHST